MATTSQKKNKTYLKREAYLTDPLVDLILLTVSDDYDPCSCPQCENIYWTYLEAMSVADSAEARIDMLVDILTLGWAKGVATIGYEAVLNVLAVAETDAAAASKLLRTLLNKDCCSVEP